MPQDSYFEGIKRQFFDALYGDKDKELAGLFRNTLFSDFMGVLEELVSEKYGYWLKEMNLAIKWEIIYKGSDDCAIPTKDASFSIIPDSKSCETDCDCEPFVEYIFTLDAEKISEDYVKDLFHRMDEDLSKYLSRAYGEWMIAMHKYHWYLFCNFGKPINIEDPTNNPQQYLLTRGTILLD